MGTAFTVSIDGTKSNDVHTGISAPERARTIHLAMSGTADDLARPVHVFPLVARPGGVLERPGHTEASVDLARLAGRLLIVTPSTAHATSAFRGEVPTSVLNLSGDSSPPGDDDLVDVSISALDWLPPELGDLGRSVLDGLAGRWRSTPKLCRAAITCVPLTPSVALAFRAPGVPTEMVRSQVFNLATWAFQEAQ